MKYAHLEAAKGLLLQEDGGLSFCIYACLELRKTIEQVVLEKLNFYATRHGVKLLFENWQPTKAMRVLCQLEPLADRSYEIRFAAETPDGGEPKEFHSLGKHEAIKVAWLQRNYNKLGSYLHYRGGPPPDESVLREFMAEVIKELDRVAASTLISDFAETVTFNCSTCEKKIVCNAEALPNLTEVICPHAECPATYSPKKSDGGQWIFEPQKTYFKCLRCKTDVSFLSSTIDFGYEFKWPKCGARHVVIKRPWAYSLAEGPP